jgi:hypothetical protein
MNTFFLRASNAGKENNPFLEADRKEFGLILFQASTWDGVHKLMWDLSFRRNTREGAFRAHKNDVERANHYLDQFAKKIGVDYKPYTLADAQASDRKAESNGDSAYSEYEQSLGSEIRIKAK